MISLILICVFFLLILFVTNIVYEYIHTFNSRKLRRKKVANNNENLVEFFLHVQILNDIVITSIVNFLIKVKLFLYCVANYIFFNRNRYIPTGSQEDPIVGVDSDYVDAHNEVDYSKRKNVQVKTIYFIRHSESVWNSVFNKGFKAATFFNLVLALLYEIFFFFSQKSALVDAPLSNKGIIQSIELSNFLQQEKSETKNDDKRCVVPMNPLYRDHEETCADENEDLEMSIMNKQIEHNAGGDDEEDEDFMQNSSPNRNYVSVKYADKNSGRKGPVVDYVHAVDGETGNNTGQSIRKRRHGKDADVDANTSTNKDTYQDGNAYTNDELTMHPSDTHMGDNHPNNQEDPRNDPQVSRNNYYENYNPKEMLSRSVKDHIDILNNTVNYPSAILCSGLRRAISTCFIGLYNRINRNNEQIQVLNSLQEISRNPDCVSLFDFYDNKYISTDIENFVHKDVERMCKRNIRIKRNYVSNKFFDTLSYIFNKDTNIFIIFGHSLWFLLFFNYFLKEPHRAKTHKMHNSAIVVFNIVKYEEDAKVNYEIQKGSVRVLYKGFVDKKYNKLD
ncbi:hypothetical protein AK88_01771 [Plasmodium fragile]|uniref:Phosphoglycerate mutase n=1 Tax=Plasmodium fragile TaxID=5857 RepID=A0A0D9QNW4_PLAFR|nr:uncharacterized protein AK88_01771 [Plasmodium fragile]KJP88492.1 hypothetical protein AK88_01771 [Plasmodium fragile]